MATKKKTGRKPAGSARSGSTNAKKQTRSTPAKEREREEANAEARRQIFAIILLAVSVFLLAVVFISAGGIWNWLRIVLFGLFGFAAYILPIILIVLDVMILAGRMSTGLVYKIIEALVLMSLIVSFVHIVQYDAETAKPFTEQFRDAFNLYRLSGATSGAGCLGALIGGGLLAATGGSKAAAGVLVCLLIFVFLMLFTGTTLINLYHGLKKPVKKVEEYTEEKIDMFREASKRSADNADDLDELAAAADRASKKKKPTEQEKAKPVDGVRVGSDIDIPLDAKSSKDMGIESFFSEMEKGKAQSLKKQPEFIRLINEDGKAGEAEELTVKPAAEKPKEKAATVVKQPEATGAAEKESREDKKQESNRKDYVLPPIDCLKQPSNKSNIDYSEELQINAKKIVQTLNSFGVSTKIVDICRSPSVTRYELQPDPGVKISRITSLADDLALSLAAAGVRIEAPIPNKSAVGIEVPNKDRNMVLLRELIDTQQFKTAKSKLNIALGRDIQGTPTYADIAKMPHLLIAGTTGSGKSVCLNTMIVSLLYNASPQEVKMIMIDPKMVEFTVYSGIPHLLVPVVADPRKASGSLSWAVTEMEKRYKLFSECGVRNLQGYNAMLQGKGEAPLPQIVMFIDELSDLMMVASNEVESSICRLAQKARAAGMHLVVATQRPSVDVITGLIKANIPSRLALSVSSQIDSRTILDSVGAEKLLGNGDMLFCPVGTAKPIRLQGAYISDEEIEAIVDHIKSQEQTNYDDEVMEEIERHAAADPKKKKGSEIASLEGGDEDTDELFPKAVEVVVEAGMASTTLLQRKLKLGYARAARIVDELAEKGIIGPFEGSKPRKVLITKQQWYEMSALSSGPSQVTYEDVLSTGNEETPAVDENESNGDDISSSDNHNYFGGYSHSNYEDVFSSSYTDPDEENN